MQIQRVEATRHRVSVNVPLLERPITRNVTFVRVETNDGAVGYGLAGPMLPAPVTEFINHDLAPFMRGRDPLMTEQWWHEAYWRFNQRSLSGVVSAGLSGVDIALWDLKGRVLGQPVWRLLGGYSAKVPAYITFGLPDYSREQLVQVAREQIAQGADKLKMVVARAGSIKEDVARVRTVREAIGPDVELMMDANHLFEPLEAAELCRRVEQYDITWFEEPLRGNDARKLAELRRKTSIPISAGQNEGHRWRHRELIVEGAVDIVQPNVLFVGGYTEAIKVAHLAQCFNLPIANGGGWPHHNAHLMAAVPNGWRVEFHLEMWLIGNALYEGAPQPEGGWTTLSERPGLGMEPRLDALKEMTVRE